MVTKIKPYRIRDVNEPEEGNSLQYNDPNTFARGEGGGGGGSGDVVGPDSAIDGNVAVFDGKTGKLIKDSGVNLADKQDKLTAGTDLSITSLTGEKTITGVDEIALNNAAANSLEVVTIQGACEFASSETPSPENIVPIVCNNGEIKWGENGQIYIDGDTETIEDSLGNTATAEMLLGVTNGTTTIKDTQEVLSGAITRNIGFKIFTSADVIEYQSQSSNKRFVVSAGALSSLGPRLTPIFCTHFQTIDDGRSLDNVPNKSIYGATTNNLYIKYTSYTSKSAFGAWLDAQYEAGTPVVAIYPLETPTTESVEGQNLNTKSGNNTLTITQASITGLGISATYGERGALIEFTNETGYQTVSNMKSDLNNPDNTHYPTTKAVADAIQSAGGADIEYVTEQEYNDLPSSKLSDGKHYIQYKSTGLLTLEELSNICIESQEVTTS